MNVKDKSACFALLARDCRDYLKRNIEEILKGIALFKRIEIVVVENDSIDGTKEYLESISGQYNNIHIISKDTNQETFRSGDTGGSVYRMQKMVDFRNEYVRYFKENFIKELDYLIVIDADIEWFSIESVVKAVCFAPDGWAALFANGRYYARLIGRKVYCRYYDLLPLIPEKEFWGDVKFTYHPTYRELARLSDLTSMKILKRYPYFPVISAFGGIGIYNMSLYRGQEYRVIKNERSSYFETLCDHVSFNMEFREEGNNYICTDLLVDYERAKSIKQIISTFVPGKLRLFFDEKILKRVRN